MRINVMVNMILNIEESSIEKGLKSDIFEMIDDGGVIIDKAILNVESMYGDIIVKDECIKDAITNKFKKRA